MQEVERLAPETAQHLSLAQIISTAMVRNSVPMGVGGGLACLLHVGSMYRSHEDIDLYAKREHIGRLTDVLQAQFKSGLTETWAEGDSQGFELNGQRLHVIGLYTLVTRQSSMIVAPFGGTYNYEPFPIARTDSFQFETRPQLDTERMVQVMPLEAMLHMKSKDKRDKGQRDYAHIRRLYHSQAQKNPRQAAGLIERILIKYR
jgi:hypothetical protein